MFSGYGICVSDHLLFHGGIRCCGLHRDASRQPREAAPQFFIALLLITLLENYVSLKFKRSTNFQNRPFSYSLLEATQNFNAKTAA